MFHQIDKKLAEFFKDCLHYRFRISPTLSLIPVQISPNVTTIHSVCTIYPQL